MGTKACDDCYLNNDHKTGLVCAKHVKEREKRAAETARRAFDACLMAVHDAALVAISEAHSTGIGDGHALTVRMEGTADVVADFKAAFDRARELAGGV